MVKKTTGGVFLPGKDDVESPAVPAVKAIHPAGSSILVELLSPEDILGTKLVMREDAKVGNQQAYIVEFGPTVKQDEVKLKVGDRVLIQGKAMELPETKKFSSSKKKLCLVEIHNIKAVFEEDK